jgi:tetratricopeptide (TPR) repeat protein
MKRLGFALCLPLLLLLVSCSRDPKEQAQNYVEKGKSMYEKGKYKEASIMFRQALKKDARFGEAYYQLGLTELKLQRFTDAVRALRRAVDLQPNNEDAHVKLGDIFLLAYSNDPKRPKEYIEEIRELSEKLLKKNPNHYDGLRMKGYVAQANKDVPGALEAFEAANRAKPLQPEVTSVLFQTLVASDRFPEAEKLGLELIEKNKNYPLMYDLLYIQYAGRKRLEDAEKMLQKKVESNPKQPTFLTQLASHYLALRRQPEMESTVQKLVQPGAFQLGHLLAGDFFLLRARDLNRARQFYEAGIQATPTEKAVYQKRIVELLVLENKSADAAKLVDEVLKANPKDDDAIAMRASIQIQSGNKEQIQTAATDFQSLVAKNPKNALLRYNLARALLAKGEVDQSKAELEEAIKIRRDFIAAREALARLYLTRAQPGNAIKEADEILKLSPNYLPAKLIRSSALLGLGEREQARGELEEISKRNPENVEARYQIAYLAFVDKKFKESEEIFRKINQSNPDDLRSTVGVVEALSAQNRHGDAIELMKQQLARKPDRDEAKVILAGLYVRSERYDNAIQLYDELLKKNPKSASVMFRMGETYRRKGDLNASIDWLRKASSTNPNDPGVLLQLGLLLEGTGKRDQARPLYEQVLKIVPDEPTALNNLAFIKAEDGEDLDTALTMAQKARQKRPQDANIADTLGWVYVKKNLNEDAIRIYSDIVKQEPRNASFRYHYGVALMQKGDKNRAKQELEVARQNNPPRGEAERIKDLLARN